MRAAVIGLAAGVLTAVTPLEFAALWPCGALAMVLAQQSARRLRSVAIAAVAGVLVVVGAGWAPLKWEDRNRCVLAQPCASISEVAKSMHSRLPEHVDAEARVCFSNSAPSMREVREVLANELRVAVSYSSCGTGMTVLFGSHPIGRPRLSLE